MSQYPEHQAREYLLNRYAPQIQALGLHPEQVQDDFDLFKEGIIDSLGIMELVADVETHFGRPVDFEELDAEQMTILGPLAAHIQRKVAEAETDASSDGTRLEALPKGVVKVKGHSVHVWLALDDRSIRKGLMGVEAKELAPLPDGTECGMLFVFNSERPLSFWMFKTIVPLDIVYIDSNRHVINCYSAQPFETRLIYPSQRPAQYVLEVSAGLMKRWGLECGDSVEFPADLVPKKIASSKSTL